MRFLSSHLTFLVGVVLCTAAHADTFTVNSIDDTDGSTCNTTCTLRQAMNAAESTPSVADTITFDPAVFGSSRQTIKLNSRLPATLSTITINGPTVGVVLDAQKKSRICGAYLKPTQGNLTLANCALINGHVSDSGAAIDNNGGIVTLRNCTLANNDAYHGGAINNYGTATLSNCTLYGNEGTNDTVKNGGAIFNIRTLTLSNCTIVGNKTTGDGGGIYNDTGTGNLTMNNCIVAGNSATGNGPDIRNRVDSGDYNLVQNASGASLSGTHNITGQDPMLSALADNGGPTQTMALQAGSPAIDAGNSTLTPDQRGQVRPFDFPTVTNAQGGNGSDIGAFELNDAQSGLDLVVNTLDDHDDGVCGVADCTLREAINAANASGKDSTITFATSVFGSSKQTIGLTLGRLPDINSNLTLTGPSTTGAGVTLNITNTGQDNILIVDGGTVFINNLTFTGAYIAVSPVGGTTTVSGCTFTGNSFGIEAGSSTVHVNNSTFVNNGAEAVLNYGGYATMTVDSCTITANGYGVDTDTGQGTTTVSNSIVAGNGFDSYNSIDGGNNIIGGTAAEAGLQTTDGKNAVVLQDDGGPTQTIALVSGSKAIDTGATSFTTDQRGKPRPIGKAPDIGAFEVQNSAPVVNSVTITPGDPKTNDTLTANVDASDAQNDTLTYKYQWFKTTITYTQNSASSTTTPLSGETGKTLDLSKAGNGDKGDQLTVQVTANDGQLDSQPATSAPVTVQNSAPVVSNVILNQSAPTTNSTLSFTIGTETDVDGDTLTPTYQWYKNDQPLQGETGATLDLSKAGNGDKGDKIYVIVTVSDSTATDSAISSTVIIGNSEPQISSVSIVPSSPKTNDILSIQGGVATDADNDLLTVTYQWQKNGGDLAGETGATLDLSKAGNGDKNDLISVIVRASDGTAISAAFSPSVTIVNSAPIVDTLTLQPQGPKVGDPLTATASASDMDGEAVTYTFIWTRVRGRQTQVVQTTRDSTSSSDVLDAQSAGVMSGDVVTVVVTASDGTATSPQKRASIAIGNTSVQLTNLVLTPRVPRSADTLHAQVQASDADGTVPSLTFEWSKTHNGTTTPIVTTRTTSPQDSYDLSKPTYGNKGDTITLKVTASDGKSSVSLSQSLTVGNTTPVITSLSLSPKAPTTQSVVRTSASASDIDVTEHIDTFTFVYAWKAGTRALSDEHGPSVDLSKYPYLKAGDTLTLSLRVTDGTGISATQTQSIILAAPPAKSNSAGGA